MDFPPNYFPPSSHELGSSLLLELDLLRSGWAKFLVQEVHLSIWISRNQWGNTVKPEKFSASGGVTMLFVLDRLFEVASNIQFWLFWVTQVNHRIDSPVEWIYYIIYSETGTSFYRHRHNHYNKESLGQEIFYESDGTWGGYWEIKWLLRHMLRATLIF